MNSKDDDQETIEKLKTRIETLQEKQKKEEEQKEKFKHIIFFISAVIGIVSGMWTLLGVLLQRTEDPFLKYYVIAGIVLLGCIWLTMKYSKESQNRAIRWLFILTAFFTSAVIAFRLLTTYFYLINPLTQPVPMGFKVLENGKVIIDHPQEYFPYFLLIGAFILSTNTLIFYYTRDNDNQGHRMSILKDFLLLSVFIIVCRIIWYVAEAHLLIYQG